MLLRSVRMLLVLALFSVSLGATTFIVPTDEELIRASDYIVRGVIREREVFEADDRTVRTRYAIEVVRIFKGRTVPGALLHFEEYGGILPHRTSVVVGTPEYAIGEEVLVMLHFRGDRIRTTEMILGKFTPEGDRYVRGIGRDEAVSGLSETMAPHIERDRSAAEFERFIEAVVAGDDISDADYFVDPDEERSPIVRHVTSSASNYVMFSMRRDAFDSGGSVAFFTNGEQAARDSLNAVDRSLDAWSSDSDSNVAISRGGTTTATFNSFDGTNAIELAMTSGFPFCGSSAAGCTSLNSSGTHTGAGQTFNTLVDADIWIRDGFTTNQNSFDAVLTHEVGHALGFRHSNEGSPSSSNAIMNAVVSALGANLQAWDVEAVRAVYGTGGSSCDAPAITTHPQSQSITSGGSASLSVSASGTTPLSFQWFRGSAGDTSQPVGSNSSTLNTGALTETTSFWVRVTNSCGTADSQAATITVTEPQCEPPAITFGGQPQSTSIIAGSGTTLTVSASGTAPLSFQWFKGESGDTSTPISGATSSSMNTGPLNESTAFWVRITNSCGSVDSAHAIVSVSPCEVPQITAHPQDAEITAGSSATLFVNVVGTAPFTFEWFRGQSGDTSSRISSANTNTLNTGALSATTSFWVRVSNGCGSVNSQTATVTVVASCTPPAISALSSAVTITSGSSTNLSVAATGTSLQYQWFRGASGDTSAPISGATQATFNTGALTASTTFWVRVTNACGAVNSASIVVTVTAACDLSIATSPSSQTVRSGSSVVLSVVAAGTGPFGYQWFEGVSGDTARPIAGASASSMTISSIRRTTSYWVRVTSSCGVRDSSTATITVETKKRRRSVRPS